MKPIPCDYYNKIDVELFKTIRTDERYIDVNIELYQQLRYLEFIIEEIEFTFK